MISEVGLEIIIDNLIKNQFLKTLDFGNKIIIKSILYIII